MALDINKLHERLLELQREYQNSIEDLSTGEEQVIASDPLHEGNMSDDPADDADALYSAELNQAQVTQLQEQLDLVERALARMAAGTYGICPDCGKPIDARRLHALPYAQYCLDDQIKHDQTDTSL